MTLRKTAFKTAVDEILWIWQKKSNNTRHLMGGIWDAWADATGSIGKAYGYQLGVKHRFEEGVMDQVDWLLMQLKEQPYSRRMVANMFNHQDLNQMALAPCAHSLTLNVTNGKLSAILNQRSQDVLVANNWNVVQYAVLVHMFAQVSGLDVGELVHVIADAHIYARHIKQVEQLLTAKVYTAPKLMINPDVKDFYQFTLEDFVLEGYEHGPQIKGIEVAI